MSKIAFLFPGQGAQSVGMGKEAWERYDTVKALFVQASDILGYSIADVCFEGPKEKLDSTDISQPALFVTSMAAVEFLKESNPAAIEACAGVAGLSLGEYSALAFAGAISFEEGLRLVQKRGEAMQAAADACDSGMVSVLGLDAEKVAQVCDDARIDGEVLQPANYLCPGNIAVSGHKASCGKVEAVAAAAGAMKSVPLAVAGAFHTCRSTAMSMRLFMQTQASSDHCWSSKFALPFAGTTQWMQCWRMDSMSFTKSVREEFCVVCSRESNANSQRTERWTQSLKLELQFLLQTI